MTLKALGLAINKIIYLKNTGVYKWLIKLLNVPAVPTRFNI